MFSEWNVTSPIVHPQIHNRMYTLFFTVHITRVIVLFATYKHSHATLPYILAIVGLYVFDHLARIAQTWYTTVWLTTKNALNGSTQVGALVNMSIFVLSAEHGSAGSDSSSMMLPVKAQGSWTCGLLRMSGDVADARPEEKFTDIH
ncbi:hypothetical protein F5148DRAFT_1296378 [Russula earlei]|uniref:Uncharacterized protein n=1 Tax=Russula earlei TaxID=71964 RepID=A0ACC0TRN2_9AGAM|nr:hypothetical protein F5148DRAFT_1296378 [Russula earlei]